MKKKEKIIQLVPYGGVFVALTNKGRLFFYSGFKEWELIELPENINL